MIVFIARTGEEVCGTFAANDASRMVVFVFSQLRNLVKLPGPVQQILRLDLLLKQR